ncbi:hypothetical protein E4L95_05365 [Paracoccus liaowanqingii]|uniref:Uncharacterized protein n=1 Tax=Paracoccus liaowanqingii TaxID=2560053 RepID=A0A4Z1CQP6_9RHOB|nr:hypothetical protein [Paracoccus liaowanqingii]TGN67334.1 hypothetical protein E4L95_05365 [Paracoccus liaowanqingii]
MTKDSNPATKRGQVVAMGEVFPPAAATDSGTKAGSTADLKALHADLTDTYREYLDMAKAKPSMLNPAMLGLIQTFLRHNEITAEAPQKAEATELQRRLEDRIKTRDIAIARISRTGLGQTQNDTAP